MNFRCFNIKLNISAYICLIKKNKIMLKKLVLTLALGLGLSTVAFCQEGVKEGSAETKIETTAKKSCCASKTDADKKTCSKAEKKSCSSADAKKSCSKADKKSCSSADAKKSCSKADKKSCSKSEKKSCSKSEKKSCSGHKKA